MNNYKEIYVLTYQVINILTMLTELRTYILLQFLVIQGCTETRKWKLVKDVQLPFTVLGVQECAQNVLLELKSIMSKQNVVRNYIFPLESD